MPEFTWVQANQAAIEDIEAVFATGRPGTQPSRA